MEFSCSMADKNLEIAGFMAMYNKNYDEMASYIHPNVCFIGPLATMYNKESVVEAVKNFSIFFKKFTTSEKFSSENKVVLILSFDCPTHVGTFRADSFLSFDGELISRIELFYDARPFEKKKTRSLLKIKILDIHSNY